MWVALAVFLFGSAIQMGFLLIYRLELLQFLYGGKYKQHDAMPFILLSLLPFATSTAGILGTGLQALERPDQVFKSCIVGTSVSVIAGIALAATCGVSGAVAGSLISSLATTYMMLRCYRKLAHE
jgi:O-antigen/teichoic acid export membrane protein